VPKYPLLQKSGTRIFSLHAEQNTPDSRRTSGRMDVYVEDLCEGSQIKERDAEYRLLQARWATPCAKSDTAKSAGETSVSA